MPHFDQKPASFISKLCNILRSKENAKIIYWDTEQKGIRVLNQKKLEEHILPRYYRHNRFSSFVRQLNMYDFHKVHLPDHKSIFLHSEFDPKKKEHIHLIRRKITFEPRSTEKDEEFDLPSQMASKKENIFCDTFFKSSKNVLLKQSLMALCSQRNQNCNEITQEEAFTGLQQELRDLSEDKQKFQERVKQLRKERKYRIYLKSGSFMKELHEKLEICWEEKDVLSELSIQDELMFKTRRSLAPRSLKLVESGQYFRRETIGNLLNF